MKVCQSWVFTPPNSPFFIKILFMFEANPIGNLIFRMSSFTILLCCSINNQGRLVFCSRPSPLELIITLCKAWLASRMSQQIFPILSLSILPSNIHHNNSIMFFPICIVSNKWNIVGARSMAIYWIASGNFSFLVEAHSFLNDIHET